MAKGGSSGGGGKGTSMFFGQAMEKPKSFLDAIKDIEQYADQSECEMRKVYKEANSTIRNQFVTAPHLTIKERRRLFEGEVNRLMKSRGTLISTKDRIEFMEVGFKGSFISGLVTAMLTPFAIGVMERHIPVFGDAAPTLYDQIYVFMLALGFSIGYSIFISTAARFYHCGFYSRPMVTSFYSGVFVGAIFKAIICFILFHFIYFVVLKEQYIATMAKLLLHVASVDKSLAFYKWMLEFRNVFPTSAYFVVLTSVLFIAIPLIVILLTKKKSTEKFLQEAQITDYIDTSSPE